MTEKATVARRGSGLTSGEWESGIGDACRKKRMEANSEGSYGPRRAVVELLKKRRVFSFTRYITIFVIQF